MNKHYIISDTTTVVSSVSEKIIELEETQKYNDKVNSFEHKDLFSMIEELKTDVKNLYFILICCGVGLLCSGISLLALSIILNKLMIML